MPDEAVLEMFPDAQPHPADLVVPTAFMDQDEVTGKLKMPMVTIKGKRMYKPDLPNEIIKSGAISVAQLQAIVLAGNAHNRLSPARMATNIGADSS